jgi:tetratricopeptide (TPR) repeat protein
MSQQQQQPIPFNLFNFFQQQVGLDDPTSTLYTSLLLEKLHITQVNQLYNNAILDDKETSTLLEEIGITQKLHRKLIIQAVLQHNNTNTTTTSAKKSPYIPPIDSSYILTKNNPYSVELKNNKKSSPYEIGLNLFHIEHKFSEAVMAFHAAIELDPSHAEAWHMLGLTHQELDNGPSAFICYNRAIFHDPTRLDTLLSLTISYLNDHKFGQVDLTIQSWILNNPILSDLNVEKILACGDEQQQQQQEEQEDNTTFTRNPLLNTKLKNILVQAQHLAPTNPDVYDMLGIFYIGHEQYELAKAELIKASELRPNDSSILRRIGGTLICLYRSEESIPYFLRALELRPGSVRSILNLGLAYDCSSQYENAAKMYVQALSHGSSERNIWLHLKECFASLEREDLIQLVNDKNLVELIEKVKSL